MSMTDRENVLKTLCALDHRLISNEGELLEIARLYNVKAAMWRAYQGVKPGLKNGDVYEMIRQEAVHRAREDNIGVTPAGLCEILDTVIKDGPNWLGLVTKPRPWKV